MSAFTDRIYHNLLRSFGSQTAMAASKPATRRGYGGNHPHGDTEPASPDAGRVRGINSPQNQTARPDKPAV